MTGADLTAARARAKKKGSKKKQRLKPIDNSKKARKGRAFKKFVPNDVPPPGTYDPALDATLRASKRGLHDFQQDAERDTTRGRVDYDLAKGLIERSRTQQLGDIGRGYRNLATAQTSGAAGAGLLGGGYLAQALRKRRENEGRETFRLNERLDTQAGELGLNFQRSNQDRQQGLARAGREQAFFGQDTNQSRIYQARETGWIPDERPGRMRKKWGRQVMTAPGNRFILGSGRMLTQEQLRRRFRGGMYGTGGSGYSRG